jgi:hypothetical protein
MIVDEGVRKKGDRGKKYNMKKRGFQEESMEKNRHF